MVGATLLQKWIIIHKEGREKEREREREREREKEREKEKERERTLSQYLHEEEARVYLSNCGR